MWAGRRPLLRRSFAQQKGEDFTGPTLPDALRPLQGAALRRCVHGVALSEAAAAEERAAEVVAAVADHEKRREAVSAAAASRGESRRGGARRGAVGKREAVGKAALRRSSAEQR